MLLLLLLIGGTPTQRFDLIELSIVHSTESTMTQVLFLNWSPDYRRYHIEAWMIPEVGHQLPQKINGVYEYRWIGGYGPRRAIANLYQETHHSSDPERAQLKLYSEELRKGIIK